MTAVGPIRVVVLVVCAALASSHVALSASPIQRLTDDPAADLRPVWSPDGSQIAFQSNRDKRYHVYVMDADGSNVRRLSPLESDDRHPAWSPTGQAIAVDSGVDTTREIWTIDLATGARSQVTRLGAIASFPSWSPDGKRLSFYTYRSGSLDLWTIGVDGSDPRPLTTGLASEQQGQCTFACHGAPWSPDGTRIAYSTAGQSQVWTVRAADGGDPVQVSPAANGERSHFPIYLPDGRLIYVTEHVTPGRAWTDLWVTQGGGGPREPLLRDVQAQGPFAISQDGRWMLFSSPRGGSFDVYRVSLDATGEEAMRIQSADAEPSPALAARQPERPAAAAAPQTAPVPEEPAPAPGAALPPFTVPLAALGVVVVLWLGVEGALALRRRSRRRS